MDGTTEPIIAVIGRPIAGNPSQFAIERGLVSMGLDWRVLSFDLDPENIAAALEGFKVTGIAGVLIDPTVGSAASKWYTDKTKNPPADGARSDGARSDGARSDGAPAATFDCLYRDEQLELIASNEAAGWLDDLIAGRAESPRLWMGKREPASIAIDNEDVGDASDRVGWRTAERISDAKLIFVRPFDDDARFEDDGSMIDIGEWPADDGSTMVIDQSAGSWPAETFDADVLIELGYDVVTPARGRIGALARMLFRWTNRSCDNDVLADAIEEYLGV